MATSPFGEAFEKLPLQTRRAIFEALAVRRTRYIRAMGGVYDVTTKVVLLGDTPGPARPTDPNYHHTPFYSTKNSSLWLNRQLVEARIDEQDLLWFNTTLASGESLPAHHFTDLQRLNPVFICLGGKAEMWVRRVAPTSSYVKVHHPQYAKRFRSKEPYALIQELKKIVGST